jgi:hypothetical protein
MTTYFYFKCKSTHSCFGHDLTQCYVELFKQAIRCDFSDHNYLIQYDYKSSCKHSYLKNKILLMIDSSIFKTFNFFFWPIVIFE